MTPPRAPWTEAWHDLLADGEWHTADEIVGVAGRFVPDGKAARRLENMRQARMRYDGIFHDRVRNLDLVSQVLSGRRSVVLVSLDNAMRRGNVERGPGMTFRLARKATDD